MGRHNPKEEALPAFTFAADEVVEEILGDADRRRDELKLSPEERKRVIEGRRKEQAKKERAKQKAAAKRANRTELLLPTNLKAHLAELAQEASVTESQLVTFLLFEAVELYRERKIEIEPYLSISANARYDFNLIHTNDTERAAQLSKKRERRSRFNP